MKSLTIITTRSTNLPKEGKIRKTGLFDRSENITIINNPKLEEIGQKIQEEFPLYRLNDDECIVFGTKCMDKMHSVDEKREYIKAIFEDVIAALSAEEKSSLDHIYLFAHTPDLDAPKGAKISALNERSTFVQSLNLTNWDLIKGKKLIIGKGQSKNSDEIAIYFTGFSHEPQDIISLLESGSSSLKNQKNLDQSFEFWAKSLHGWSLEDTWKAAFYIKNEPPVDTYKFQFNTFIFFPDRLSKVAISPKNDESFPYQELRQELINKSEKDGQRQINVVFFPQSAVAEYSDLTFYEAVINQFHPKDKIGEAGFISHPTVFVSYHDVIREAEINEPQPDNEPQIRIAPFKLDRRVKFLDSSIWYRHVAIEGNFWENLEVALKTIGWAYDQHLYPKNVCREFLEFQNRMVLNSYLDNTYGSGHAMRVFPFTFHSERVMREKAEKTYQSLIENDLQWNVLLVDDYAESRLKEGFAEGVGQTKGEIIKNLLHEFEKTDTAFHLDARISVPEAQIVLYFSNGESTQEVQEPDMIYDMILLDYLFSHEKVKDQHYGTSLLDNIRQAKSRKGLGVLQSYWIYPITVFNEAIQSHLQEKGYQYMEEYWQLTRGADPLNTPHLFQRTLFKFMQAQSRKIQFTSKDIWFFIANTAPSLLRNDESANDKQSRQVLVPTMAKHAFRRLVQRFSVDEGLPEKSALAASVRQQMNNTGTLELRDHLRQLLYLLGFSAGFDIRFIVGEFRFIESEFKKLKENEFGEGYDRVEKGMKDLSLAVFSIHGKYY